VGWDEVRLFAVIRPGRHASPGVRYELSGSNTSLRWVYVRPHMPFNLFVARTATKPLESYADYDQQMQAVLATVISRTGLPLYDLR